jgi:hypothetical protein
VNFGAGAAGLSPSELVARGTKVNVEVEDEDGSSGSLDFSSWGAVHGLNGSGAGSGSTIRTRLGGLPILSSPEAASSDRRRCLSRD